MKNLLVILGPTAVGKTNLSLKVAEELKGEIISADSMQVYKGMDIGTAKVGLEERKRIEHHLIDIVSPDRDFSVAEYKKRVDLLIPDIINRNHFPIMVGGTGLYIQAVVDGFLFPQMEKDYELRKKLNNMAKEKGNKYVHSMLQEIDPELAKKLHPNDLRRIIRGIEVYKLTGKTISYYKKKQKERPERYKCFKIGLTRDRDELYRRINKRVDQMLEMGLVDEVKKLLESKIELSKTAKQALGYKEIIGFLQGKYDLKKAIYLLKRNTRHFAKRQLTWFKRDANIHWINLSNKKETDTLKYTLELTRDFFNIS